VELPRPEENSPVLISTLPSGTLLNDSSIVVDPALPTLPQQRKRYFTPAAYA
jgi:hypothetical protein